MPTPTTWAVTAPTTATAPTAGVVDPAPGPARDLLRRELSGGEYQQTLLERARDAVLDLVDRAVGAVAEAGAFNLLTLLVVAGVVAVGLLLLLSRLRPETRTRSRASVIGQSRRTAAEHRARARTALGAGRHDDAVVEAVRGLARDLEQRAADPEAPARGAGEVRDGSTAREVVGVASSLFGTRRRDLDAAAGTFEDVVYGGTPATREDAGRVVALVEDLAGTRAVGSADAAAVAAPR